MQAGDPPHPCLGEAEGRLAAGLCWRQQPVSGHHSRSVPADRSTLSEENKDTAKITQCDSLRPGTNTLYTPLPTHVYVCTRVSLRVTQGNKGEPGGHGRGHADDLGHRRGCGRGTRSRAQAFREDTAAVMESSCVTLSCLHTVCVRTCTDARIMVIDLLATGLRVSGDFPFLYLKALLKFLYKKFF